MTPLDRGEFLWEWRRVKQRGTYGADALWRSCSVREFRNLVAFLSAALPSLPPRVRGWAEGKLAHLSLPEKP